MKDAGCPGEWALRVLLCLLCIALAGLCPAAVVCLLTCRGCPASLGVPPVVFLGFLPKKMWKKKKNLPVPGCCEVDAADTCIYIVTYSLCVPCIDVRLG